MNWIINSQDTDEYSESQQPPPRSLELPKKAKVGDVVRVLFCLGKQVGAEIVNS
jgi:hypothetical protein